MNEGWVSRRQDRQILVWLRLAHLSLPVPGLTHLKLPGPGSFWQEIFPPVPAQPTCIQGQVMRVVGAKGKRDFRVWPE